MSQQTFQATKEKMAVMVEDDNIVRMGKTTMKGPIDEEEASGILSVRSKGKGKEIKIDGVNYNIDVHQAAKSSDLNSYSVPGPNLVGLQKETRGPEVKYLDSHKVNTALPKENIYADKQNKLLQPRPESSVPPKKRNTPYHRSLHKTHDAIVRKDLREMKVKIDETPLFPTKELNQLLESVVKSYIQNKTIIKIDGEPHHLTATPVGAVEAQATGGMEDLYGGKIDRPPPVSDHVRNHGPEGGPSDVNIPAEVEEEIRNESDIMSHQAEDLAQNPGEFESTGNEFIHKPEVPTDDIGQPFNPFYNETHENVEEFGYQYSYMEDDCDQPLDLSRTNKTSVPYQSKIEVATTEQIRVERAEEKNLPVLDYNVDSYQLNITENFTKPMAVKQQLGVLMAQYLERLRMNTPEPRDDMSTHHLLTTSSSYSQGSNLINNIPEIDQIAHQVASMPNLASLEMTNSDGSVKESRGELIKRKLKDKIKNT